jgi:hypothetical protein
MAINRWRVLKFWALRFEFDHPDEDEASPAPRYNQKLKTQNLKLIPGSPYNFTLNPIIFNPFEGLYLRKRCRERDRETPANLPLERGRLGRVIKFELLIENEI